MEYQWLQLAFGPPSYSENSGGSVMRLNTEDLNQLAACAVAAVEAAGIVITQYDRRELTVQHKAGG